MDTRKLKILYWTLGLSVVLTFGIYIINFKTMPLSKDADKWGVFGDYLGGVLNPITSALNVVAFIFLTKTLADLDKKRLRDELIHQKTLTIATMKHAAYSEFSTNIDTLSQKVINVIDNQAEIVHLCYYISGFRNNMSHLFPFLANQEATQPLIQTLTGFIELSDELKNKTLEETKTIISEKFKPLVVTFYQQKATIIKKFQEELIK